MLIHEFIIASRTEILLNVSYDMIKNRECVKISDDIILDNYKDFSKSYKTHWFSLENVDEGLNYHGITIILNENLQQFMIVLQKIFVFFSIGTFIFADFML